MKRILLFSAVAVLCTANAFAQDDDMYFMPARGAKAQPHVAVAEPGYDDGEPAYYCGSMRSVDEYNRRGRTGAYAQCAQDSLCYGDSLPVWREDYENSMRMRRFEGYSNITLVVNDPWWYDPWHYDSWWYDNWGWRAGYYNLYGWYTPWYRYDPWYYGARWPYSLYSYRHYYGGWHAPHHGWGHVAARPVGGRAERQGGAARRVHAPGNRYPSSAGRQAEANRRVRGGNVTTMPSRNYNSGNSFGGNDSRASGGSSSRGGSFSSGGGGSRSSGGGGARSGGSFGGGRR